ncbi:DEAD/DEAH box helicase [Flammeovirga aprica]|uniref:DEAD/DEAH box helicase n=1 Tax=Flammeovirga aprica JL-4 TaxID=694437 RepID=A0A7X9S1A6_9BACT|nr:DEAD/DEAH box helicase [Flammeovirga aprica]NME72337.1 DEAD/DEAH box helicase [Flammeovirga aprica JL-4]
MSDKKLRGKQCVFPKDYTLIELKEDIYEHLEVVPSAIPLNGFFYEKPYENLISFEFDEEDYSHEIEFLIENDNVRATCDCSKNGFCQHMAGALLYYSLKRGGDHYIFEEYLMREKKRESLSLPSEEKRRFQAHLQHDVKEITAQLKPYGFTYEEDWNKYFDVEKDWRGIEVIPKSENLIPGEYLSVWKNSSPFQKKEVKLPFSIKKTSEVEKCTAIVWTVNEDEIWPSSHLLIGKKKKNGNIGNPFKHFTRDSLDNAYSYRSNDLLPKEIEELGLKISAFEKDQYLHSRGFYTLSPEKAPEHLKVAYFMMQEVLPDMLQYPQYIAEGDVAYLRISELVPVTYHEKEKISFKFSYRNGFYTLKPYVHVNGEKLEITQLVCFGMINVGEMLLPLTLDESFLLCTFASMKGMRVKDSFIADFLPSVLEIQKKFDVQFSGIKINQTKEDLTLEKRKIYLSEEDDYLLLKPSVQYTHPKIGEKEYALDGDKVDSIDLGEGEILNAQRDIAGEEVFQTLVSSLHPSFESQETHFKYLHNEEVLREQWFIKMYAQLEEEGVEVLGRKSLKKTKLNPHKPMTKLTASSGVDWFDLEVQVSFGEQAVKLADVRKAIVNRQDYVKLGDGSLGFLPKDWLEKYSNLFKMGKIRKDSVRISAYQPSLIDEMYDEMLNKEVFDEILEKQKNLRNFRNMPEVTLPKEVNATLRPYQKEGFKWLTFLDDIKWGGCLADDMGLGKTLQVLTFLQHLKENKKAKKGVPHLIVVPRSLVFNWQREAEKFCEGLSILDNSHADRTKDSKEFKKYDAVIMTYAMVRMDVEHLKKIKFHYVILDESQAIKNPLAQTSKAVKLLKAQNRIVITGTPVENNTFDLFSQMDFLNPGMLGTVKSFKEQYADQIDKHRDQATAEELRKMIYPFMLRRKKDDVAKDLPSKVEQILYCEMDTTQRRIYDQHKNEIREKIMEVMASEAPHMAGMHIIQGLMKLRQICNSPTLLSNDENGEYPSNSAKLSLLMEQVEELVKEGHKVLIFSFFVEMLGLIGTDLEKRGVDYCKLLGGSKNREELVQEFKENEEKKAFLISLKAGGFGLNLTEASYVFLVDPWWNPAVEQQAIDRTHRIGQENPVFAYKMICKDSIEEKILEIQEKKKGVADDVISTESSFIKNITKEDIKVLFD